MRVIWKAAAFIALPASFVVGCSPSGATGSVGYAQFQFMCCANSEALTHAWHPGQVITLQWSAESTGVTATDARNPITLSAIVTGPYTSVAALKAGGTHAQTLVAPPMRVTDRTSENAFSTIALPFDLPAGWYDLVTAIKSAGGSVGGATVIQVLPLSS